jgi:hypothetical protein
MDTPKPASVINIALVGGGAQCAEILQKTTSVYEREEIYAPILAVADSNPESPGMREADRLDMLTFTDYHDLYDDRYSIHLLILLTPEQAVLEDILRTRPKLICLPLSTFLAMA